MTNLHRVVVATLLASLLTGCGGVRDHIRSQNTPPEVLDPVGTYLGPRVGVFTYDDALIEWGHPKHVTDGDSIFLATWTANEAERIGGRFAQVFSDDEAGESLNVTFDVASRTLQTFGFSDK